MIAAIGAKKGTCSGNTSSATYHDATAAIIVCRIRQPASRRRPSGRVSSACRDRSTLI